jgi:hypothetical protein
VDLEAIEERVKRLNQLKARATPGPWRVSHRAYGCDENDDESAGLGLEIEGPPEPGLRGQFARSADAQLVAFVRNNDIERDLEQLIAEVRRLTRSARGGPQPRPTL